MRTVLLIAPGWSGNPDSDSFLKAKGPALRSLESIGRTYKVVDSPSLTPEAAYLGLHPEETLLAEGPLVVASLGVDPPERSVHFHLSLLSSDGERAWMPEYLPTEADIKELMKAVERLNTSKLTSVKGFGLSHGLVWEDGSIDLQTIAPTSEFEIRDSLPAGDGEPALRRFIDDSLNLLSGLELNRRRLDEGASPFNLLWPWGQGFRGSVPSLLLKFGRVPVESPSVRLAGLTRLVGWSHGDLRGFGRGTAVNFKQIRKAVESSVRSVIFLPSFQEFRSEEKYEEMDWMTKEVERELLQPIIEMDRSSRWLIVSPGDWGLGLMADPELPDSGTIPFDERAFDGAETPTLSTYDLVSRMLRLKE